MTKGNQVGTEQFLISVPLPQETDTYTVISHQEIIEKVENELNNASLEIIKVDYTYSFGGEVALARVYIKSVVDADMGMLFTWQNSYNKKVKFSCAIGAYIHDNNASLIGTEGLSWIRKHTGTANSEAFEVIESLIDLADTHFTKIIAEKERMKAMELDTESYAHVMGALYFEHSLVTSTQASAVKQEREKPVHTYSDKDTLWGLYKLLMYGIENMDITRWQASQQKLHHLIMAEYAISQERMDHLQTCALSADIHAKDMIDERTPIGPGITPMGPRVVVEEDEDGNPLVSAQPIMIDYSAEEQLADAMVAPFKADIPLPLTTLSEILEKEDEEEFTWNTSEDKQTATEEGLDHNDPEIHIESDEEYAERVAIIEGEQEEDPFITDEEEDEVMDAMLTPRPLVETFDKDSEFKQEFSEQLRNTSTADLLNIIPPHHEPLIPTQEELDAEHVGPPEMYTGTEDSSDLLSQVESSVEETLDATDLFGGTTEEEVVEVDEDNLVEDPVKLAEEVTGVSNDVEETQEDEGIDKVGFEEEVSKEVVEELAEKPVDFAALANKYSEEELNEPVPIIPPTINLPKEKEVIRSQQPVTTKEAFKEEENFLDVTEHEGLTVPEGMIENAAVIEKKMILLYGSVRPYQVEECSGQLNVTIEDTYESFYVSI